MWRESIFGDKHRIIQRETYYSAVLDIHAKRSGKNQLNDPNPDHLMTSAALSLYLMEGVKQLVHYLT